MVENALTAHMKWQDMQMALPGSQLASFDTHEGWDLRGLTLSFSVEYNF
jgi:hypothetical protein